MEVSNYFIDANTTFDAASFAALGIQMFGVVFTLALLYAFAAAEGPGDGGVGFANLITGVAAVFLDGIFWGRGAVTLTTVFGVEMLGVVLVSIRSLY